MIPAITTAAITTTAETALITIIIITTMSLILTLTLYGELDMPSGKGSCAPL
jgi:VIT1/CCC1 family predicted Fe2+/Mn2+ transporter